jgi:hypothetical protein
VIPSAPSIPTLPGLEIPDTARGFLERSGPGMGEYSGDILKARHPQLYQAAIELLARGYGIRDTAEILKMSARSVMAIRDREPESIATIKHKVSRRFLDVATLAAEVARDRLTDHPDTITFKDLMIGGAVATDKHLILSGEATQRIEHVTRQTDDDFSRMLEDARARGRLIEGEIVQETDITQEDRGQRGGAAAGSLAAGSVAADDAGAPCLDIQSSDIGALHGDSCAIDDDATGTATGGPAPSGSAGGARLAVGGRAGEGGRGSGEAGGPVIQMNVTSEKFQERSDDHELPVE